MNVEHKIARELNNLFDEEHFKMQDDVFLLSHCAPMVKESAAELYLALSQPDDQIDAIVEAFAQVQASDKEHPVANALFGSPLHGMKLLREQITGYVVSIIQDEVDDYMAQFISANRQSAADDRAYELREVLG